MTTYVVFLALLFSLCFLDQLGVRSRDTAGHSLQTCTTPASSPVDVRRALSGAMTVATIVVALFSGLRYFVGWDYAAYYETIVDGTATNILLRGEYLNVILIELARRTGIPQLYFLINSALTVFLISQCLKRYSPGYWCSLFVFVCFPLFYLNSMSVVRMFSALSLAFYGFRYIVERKPLKYVFLVLLASMFHKSALFALVLYLARYVRLKTWKLGLILASLPLLSRVLLHVVNVYLPQYAVYTRVTARREGTLAIWFFIGLGLIAVMFRDRIVASDDTADLYYNNFMVGLAVYLMFYAQGTMGHRLSLYGTIYSLLLIPKIISLFRARDRVLLVGLLYALCVVMFLYIVRGGSATYIPYRSVLDTW